MIIFEKDQPMFTDEHWLVLIPGSYSPDDLVEVYNINFPEQIVAYYAQFVLNGEFP